jgi:hypothetical protein
MTSKGTPVVSIVAVVALIVPLACSGGMGAAPGDDRRFVPENLPNTPRAGEVGVTLKLVAWTLVQGPTAAELYAAVRNDGNAPSCEAGMMTDFIDEAGQTVVSVGSALQSKQLYRLDATTIVSCIDPGQIAMSASLNLPAAVVIEELGSLTHTFPTFGGFDGLVPVAGFTIDQVETVAKGGGSAYTGTLSNGFDTTVSAPSVTIFPVNRVGRPLGAATASATTDIPPGASWSFETSAVNDPGVDHVAYPAGSIN